MKKLLSVLLAVCIMLTLSVSVFADPITEDGDYEVTVTAVVPASYTVSIPADTTVTYNVASTEFGAITLTAARLEAGKAVEVTVDAGALENAAEETIAYTINDAAGEFSSATFDEANESVALTIEIAPDAWTAAEAGTYNATVTFTVETVDAPQGN